MPQTKDWTNPRMVDAPQPGFYRLKLVKGGWAVPAEIIGWRSTADGTPEGLDVTVDGVPALGCWTLAEAAALPDTHLLQRVHLYGERIDQTEFAYLNALREFCKLRKPLHPCCNPTQPIDLRLQPIEEF